jgi:hypothetical protein
MSVSRALEGLVGFEPTACGLELWNSTAGRTRDNLLGRQERAGLRDIDDGRAGLAAVTAAGRQKGGLELRYCLAVEEDGEQRPLRKRQAHR